MRRREILAGGLFFCTVVAGARSEFAPDPERIPQMQLKLYVRQVAHLFWRATERSALRLGALRAEGLPNQGVPRTRFVVEFQGVINEPQARVVCLPALFEPATPEVEPLLNLAEEPDPLEWLEGEFRISPGSPWSEVRFLGLRPFVFYSLDPAGRGLREGEQFRVAVRFSWGFQPSIERVVQAGKVLYDASVCRLHQVKMARTPIPLSWGLATDANLWPTAGVKGPPGDAQASFPNYIERWNGGCVVTTDSPVLYTHICPTCARAYGEWLRRRQESQK